MEHFYHCHLGYKDKRKAQPLCRGDIMNTLLESQYSRITPPKTPPGKSKHNLISYESAHTAEGKEGKKITLNSESIIPSRMMEIIYYELVKKMFPLHNFAGR